MASATCPACGTKQDVIDGLLSYRCRSCAQTVRYLQCKKCRGAIEVAGSGTGHVKCPRCRKTNQVPPLAAYRQANAAAREVERARKAYERSETANEKEHRRLYQESRGAEATLENEELQAKAGRLETILADTLAVDDHIDFEALKDQPNAPPFDPGGLDVPEPPLLVETFMPPELTGPAKIIPGAAKRHAAAMAEGQANHEAAVAARETREAHRTQALEAARAAYAAHIDELRTALAPQHADIDAKRQAFETSDPTAIVWYFTQVLEASSYPDDFPQSFRMAYVGESRQLVVEYQLPGIEVVPEVATYKYVKTSDTIASTPRPTAKLRALYTSVISQVTLRTLHEIFESDRTDKVDVVVFNGYVDSVDKATGKPVTTYLVTVRTTRDLFLELALDKVDPILCLKALNASVSKSPAELTPIRPVLDFRMVDPRFVQEQDIISSLDQRPNLMELAPSEFESLITNLFEKMGLETRLTQASRDGGVDCVAYDPRPIFGGKVVIQAKRYKNTVGVSAVRDLFGTMQNEGAAKGILVTTSGYGKASFDFAENKPLELLSGSNLLYLLAEHAGIEAKIEAPEDWVDPVGDIESDLP